MSQQNIGNKFTVLPKCSVGLYAETVGCPNLGENVLESLSEDITYRLKETIQNATRVMRHCKRRCLTTNDFATALKWSDNQLIYGHNGIDVSHFKSFNFKEKSISFIEDKDLHLRETAFDQTVPADPGDITLKAQWLVFEGHSCAGGKQNKENTLNRETLEEPFASFLRQAISAVFGTNAKAKKAALEMIHTSSKLQAMLPYLVTFLASQVKACNGNDTLKNIVRGTLSVIQAIVDNTSLFLVPYVLQIVKLLLFVITEGELAVSYWQCKLTAARILTQICRCHMSTMNYLPHHLLKAYQENLLDDSKPLGAVFGAAFGISCLGVEPTHQVLYPVLKKKCEKLKADVENCTNLTVLSESLMVYGLLQDIAVFLAQSAAATNNLYNLKSTGRSSSTAGWKYFAVYEELVHVFEEGFGAQTHFANLISNNNRTVAQQQSKHAKHEQNSKPKDFFRQDSGTNKVDCSYANLFSGTTQGFEKMRTELPMMRRMNASFTSLDIQTSLGIVKNVLKWRSPSTLRGINLFQDLKGQVLTEGPTKAKKRKFDDVDGSQPLSHTTSVNKRDHPTKKIFRQRRMDLTKATLTLNIFL